MKSLYLVFVFSLGLSYNASSQKSISAEALIAESIKYHDPKSKLSRLEWKMDFEDSRPDGSKRKAYFKFDPSNYNFEMQRESGGKKILMGMTDKVFKASIDGSSDYTTEEAKTNRLEEGRAVMMRNYYHYLWCLPMKLLDPGTIVDDEVKQVDFFGKESLEVRVTYTEEVGEDIWYFYFHPKTKAMHGYRFYHDEAVNDGEYILLEGEYESDGVRIPQTRKWYTHKEAKFLGEDKLVGLTIY